MRLIILTTLAACAAAITQTSLSPPVRAIYNRILTQTTDDATPTPKDHILTFGHLRRHYKHYGDSLAFPRKLFYGEIMNAKEEVLITTFIWDGTRNSTNQLVHPTPATLVDAMVELDKNAKRLGRIIRFYLAFDSLGTATFTKTKPPMQLNGLVTDITQYGFPDAKTFPNLDIKLLKFHQGILGSLHSKMILIDGKTAIMGSKNMDGDTGFEYMFLMDGGLARSLRLDFAQIWQLPLPAVQTAPIQYDSQRHVPVLVVSSPQSDIGRGHDEKVPQDIAWLEGLKQAKSHVFIMTPNFNTAAMVNAVMETIQRGITVTIIAAIHQNEYVQRGYPGSIGSNGQTMNLMYSKLQPASVAHRLRWCWFKGDRVSPYADAYAQEWSHVKFMSVDDAFAIVGSGNHDPQSWYYSRENNVLIDDPKTTHLMEEALRKQQHSLDNCYTGEPGEVRQA